MTDQIRSNPYEQSILDGATEYHVHFFRRRNGPSRLPAATLAEAVELIDSSDHAGAAFVYAEMPICGFNHGALAASRDKQGSWKFA